MDYLLILIAGTVAGFLNTVAGGGSLITLPILIFMGLPSATANGTNRIALLFQNISATMGFKRRGYFYPTLAVWLGIPAVIGAFVGSRIAVSLPDVLFNRILSIVMIVVLTLILTRPEKRFLKQTGASELTGTRRWVAVGVFFLVGIYGGFIQAGVGFILIVSLSLLTGLPLVNVNAIKVAIVAIYTAMALAVFVLNGNVEWGLGLLLAVGNSFGAYLGSVFAVKKGDRYIRMIITVSVIVMAGKLWGLWL